MKKIFFDQVLLYLFSFLIGLAPVQLINHSKHHMISYGEKENANSKGKSYIKHSVEITEIPSLPSHFVDKQRFY